MYKLSKRKEHAFIEKLTDNNIKIFCGDIDPTKIDLLQKHSHNDASFSAKKSRTGQKVSESELERRPSRR